MKKCSYCGLENPDDATQCVTCHTDFATPVSSAMPEQETKPVTQIDEQRFWERMTFKQFVALFMRLQAVWLLWYAAIDATYIPAYFGRSFYVGGMYVNPGNSPGERLDFFLLIFRIILHVAAAVAVIRYADRLVGWLVRDWIRHQPPNTTAAAPSVSDEPGNPKTGNESTSASGGGGSALDR